MPIFDGFKREARIAEEKARQREAEVTYQDTRLRTEVEVRSAMLDLAAAKERVAATEVQLRLAEQEVRQAKERFKAGIAGNSDVIQASLTLNGARDQVVGALTAYHVARVEVAKAQGATTGLK
jgi:outer membrane protein TolC